MKRKKKIKAADLPLFDPAAYLGNEEAIAAYLTDVLEANDAALLASALGDIARAHGMSVIAKKAGIARRPPGRTAGPLTVMVDLSATRRHSQPFSLKAERSTPGGAYQPSAP